MTAQLLGYRSCLAEHLVPSGGDLIQGDEYKLMGGGQILIRGMKSYVLQQRGIFILSLFHFWDYSWLVYMIYF